LRNFKSIETHTKSTHETHMLLPMSSSYYVPDTPRAPPPTASYPPTTPNHTPWLSSPSPNVIQTSFTCLTPPASFPSFPLPHHHGNTPPKRGRADSELTQDERVNYQVERISPPDMTPNSKKSRVNTYIAPRAAAKPSLIATLGSLVGGPTGATGAASSKSHPNLRVHLRKQLSGGQLDPFLGDHDSMDVETAENRPRSMSF
jgi:hypothetical protein